MKKVFRTATNKRETFQQALPHALSHTLLLSGLLLCVAGCAAGMAESIGAGRHELIVFAAASLTDAFNELAQEFEAQNPGIDVVLNFAGSSQLAAQLREGAIADVFVSANPAQMQAVVKVGRIEEGAPTTVASNRLTIIVPADNPAQVASLGDLGQSSLQLVLAVEGVPVRAYSDEIIAKMPATFQKQFYANLVSEEDNVRQVTAKVALGEADAGIVYISDVTPDIKQKVRQIVIPDAQNISATYPAAPLADAPQPELAKRFVDFLLSPEGQAILARGGFGPPPTS